MDRAELERLDREGLVMRAQAAGIRRARVLTRPELIDELLRLDPAVDATQLKKTRGFFGIARDLLSRVVERGLHLPDAADRLRAALGNPLPHVPRPEPQAVPTVTLAEIYAAQGHKQRAIETLKRVLEAEPEHGAARALLEKLQAADYVPPPPPLPPEPDEPADEIGAHLRSAAAEEELPSTARPGEGEDEAAPEAVHAAPNVGDVEEVEEEPAAPELPTARERTECVAIPLDDTTSYVWWSLAPDARPIVEEAFFFVRAVIFVPTWDGPVRETRDVACDPAAGELVLRDLPERAVVRIAVGVMEEGDLVPIAHSPALEMTAARGLVEWTPGGTLPIVVEQRAAVARAAERARMIGHRPGAG